MIYIYTLSLLIIYTTLLASLKYNKVSLYTLILQNNRSTEPLIDTHQPIDQQQIGLKQGSVLTK